MQFEIKPGGVSTTDINGNVLLWSMDGYYRSKMAKPDVIFRDINDYMSRLPVNRQVELGKLYSEIHGLFKKTMSVQTLTDKLIELIEKLYILVQLPEIYFWVKKHSKITYPTTLRYVHDEDDINPNRTYLREDYDGLIVLSIALRPMVPIWGEFIGVLKRKTDAAVNIHKEYVALKLLARSSLMESEYVERLIRYIEASFGKEVDTNVVILSTFSSSEISTWLLALCLIRRLSTGEIDTDDPKSSGIISSVHTYVLHTILGLQKKFGDYKDKFSKASDSDGDKSNSSRLDAYRVRQDISTGDQMVFTVFTRKHRRIKRHIDTTIPDELVQACVDNLHNNHPNMSIKDEHITMLQWIGAAAIPPRSVPLLERKSLLNLLGVCQAALFHWGYEDLAHLITSIPLSKDTDIMNIREEPAKGVISNSLAVLLKELDIYYPQTGYDTVLKRPINLAYVSVQKLVSGFNAYDWISTVPENFNNGSQTYIGGNSRIEIGPNLQVSLINLILDLNKRSESIHE